ARCHLSSIELRHPGVCHPRTLQETCSQSPQFFPPFHTGTGIALSLSTEGLERCPDCFISSLFCLSSPGFGSSGSLCLRLTGVEIAAVWTEESQNTCVRRPRKRVLEAG